MVRIFHAALAAALVAFPALAADLFVQDVHARSANPRTAAAFMTIVNPNAEDDRLVAARADIARRVELHTHLMEDGIARMRQVEAIDVPAQGEARLQRGGDHVMFIGLEAPLVDGQRFPLTLVFESGAELVVEVEVDNARQAGPGPHGARHGAGAAESHGGMKGHGAAQGPGSLPPAD